MTKHLLFSLSLLLVSACSTMHITETSKPASLVKQDYVQAAKEAAGSQWSNKVDGFCAVTPGSMADRPPPGGHNRKLPHVPVPRKNWPEPATKVFDNLYFTGSKAVTSFAITTSAGIIITDAMWAYDIEQSVAGGLTSLGVNPKDIKYVIIPHGHPDHYGGANFLNDSFGAKIVAPKDEIGEIARFKNIDTTPQPNQYDVLIGDRDTLTLGDTTVTFHDMPGHSPSGVVMTFPIMLKNKKHEMLIWSAGGAAPNKKTALQKQIPALKTLIEYVKATNIEAFSQNHGGHVMAEQLRVNPADSNPFLYGNQKIVNYLTMRLYCNFARLEKLESLLK